MDCKHLAAAPRESYRAMTILNSRTAQFGNFLRDHAHWLRKLQWVVVFFYLFLLIIPTLVSLPDESARVFNHLVIFAQFAFWGIWWPFVLISMLLMGRVWCGWFCPEGMLTEWASERGRNHPIPRWMRWQGWPFVAFACTTVYGQLLSVYQYPLAAMLVLGGSTVAAVGVGYWYGRSKRVWCRYLCPVNGVFNLLAKLAPWHYKVDVDAWKAPQQKVIPVNCAPLVPMRNMQGATECHMCGRCSDYRGAITLSVRSPEAEITQFSKGSGWETVLILFGLMGLAVGAFQWTASPWLVDAKQMMAEWLVNREIFWPLQDNAPWWILTHYPEVNDSFSWLDGGLIVAYIGCSMLFLGGSLYLCLKLADWMLPKRDALSVHKLTQSFIPAAACGVFLGLSALTVNLLKHEGVATAWAPAVRAVLLSLALLWSLRLFWRLASQRTMQWWPRLGALALAGLGLALYGWAWVLLFFVWA